MVMVNSEKMKNGGGMKMKMENEVRKVVRKTFLELK